MKRITLLLVAVLGTVHAMAAVVLPIEVFGASGHVETVEIPLPQGSPAVTALSLRVHGLNAQDKMSIRLNDNPDWITLNRGNVTFPFPDGKFFGMSGAQGTIRMVVPIPSGIVLPGQNTIRFRFNDRDGLSIGYRVLAVNFLATSESQPLVPANEFVQDDPSTWKAPIDTAEAVAEGKSLWYTAKLWDNGRPIRATCSDCHAHDGRDLKYFNYSNRSIVERSIYHRLTQEQGSKIASYIRSLPIPYEENGRPWNPPYQPGPGIDSKPVRSWAAGAGLEWVLDRDIDTLRYIFPDDESISSYNFTKTTNAREIPLYIQLPDWNHWLPAVHPFDQASAQGVQNPAELPPIVAYKSTRTQIQSKLAKEGRLPAVKELFFATRQIITRAIFGSVVNTADTMQWRATKLWEMMQEFGFEGAGQEYFGPRGNPRTWYGGEIFRTAQHLTGRQSTKSWEFQSMTWYQLQLVLNDGNRVAWDTEPIDWGYLLAFSIVREPLPPSYSVWLLNKIKSGEACADFQNLAGVNSLKGWWAHWSFPGPLMGRGGWVASEVDRLNPALKDKISIALAKAWLDKSEQFSSKDYATAYNDAHLISIGWAAFSPLPTTLESIGADQNLVQRARNFIIGMNPNLGTNPPPPTNLRAN